MKIEQFLADPSFENWARQSNAEDVAQWESWRAKHPEHAELMDEARAMIVGLPFEQQKRESLTDKNADWEALSQRLNLTQQPATVRRFNRRTWWGIAASLALLIAAGWWLVSESKPSTEDWLTLQAGYGEIQSVRLADGSKVTLNANSMLRYPEQWAEGDDRVVELTGEAFFEVTHQYNNAPFIVKAGSMAVRVLGTTFNVTARRQEPMVSLVEGKVSLSHHQSHGPVLLAPGETARFDSTQEQFNITTGETEQMTSWREHRWVFDDTPLVEILQRIEDEFGLKVRQVDSQLLNRKVSGQVSTREKATLFLALEALLDVKITEKSGELIIKD